jgi:hypothetical protein
MVVFASGRKRDKRVVAYKKKLEEKAEENKQKTREFQKKQREERKKLLETAPDGGFHMNSMEEQLRQLEGAWEKNTFELFCFSIRTKSRKGSSFLMTFTCNQCCESGKFLPDHRSGILFFHPGSRMKKFSIFNPKNSY